MCQQPGEVGVGREREGEVGGSRPNESRGVVTLSDEITNMLGLAGPVKIGRAITQVVQARGLLKDK